MCESHWHFQPLQAFNHENPKHVTKSRRSHSWGPIKWHQKRFVAFEFIGAGCFWLFWCMYACAAAAVDSCYFRTRRARIAKSSTLISTSSSLLLSLLCVSEDGKNHLLSLKVLPLNRFHLVCSMRLPCIENGLFEATASIYNIYFSCFIMCQSNYAHCTQSIASLSLRLSIATTIYFFFFCIFAQRLVALRIVQMEIKNCSHLLKITQKKRTVLIVINGFHYGNG